MVVVEGNILPKNCLGLLKYLLSNLDYRLAFDSSKGVFFKKFEGFSRDTLDSKNIHPGNELLYARLNDMAYIITEIVCERRQIKMTKMERVMWNLYRPGDEGSFHKDADLNDKKKSILFTLNSSDGCLIVGQDKYKDVENEAKLFDSHLLHKGIGPKNDPYRLNVNIVFGWS